MRAAVLSAAVVVLLAAAAPSASAQVPDLPDLPIPVPPILPGQGGTPTDPVLPYGANDGGGFRDILPPGTNGRYDAAQLAGFLATGATVPHCCEQLPMYGDLVYATPGLKAADVGKYFKDSTFGVRPGDAERTYSPRADVTIVRDKGSASRTSTARRATAPCSG